MTYTEWLESNPIRQYRISKGFNSVVKAGEAWGIDSPKLRVWEKGIISPNGPHTMKLEAIIPGFLEKHTKWLASKPEVNKVVEVEEPKS